MNGRAEVTRIRQRLEETMRRVNLTGFDPELQSDFAKYLCILVSGNVEVAVRELLLEHSRRSAGPTVQRFVEMRIRRLTNLNSENLKQLIGSFDADWRESLSYFLVDEKKDALDSVINLRNMISHGHSVGVTYQRVNEYFQHIKPIVDMVADLCVPVS